MGKKAVKNQTHKSQVQGVSPSCCRALLSPSQRARQDGTEKEGEAGWEGGRDFLTQHSWGKPGKAQQLAEHSCGWQWPVGGGARPCSAWAGRGGSLCPLLGGIQACSRLGRSQAPHGRTSLCFAKWLAPEMVGIRDPLPESRRRALFPTGNTINC